MADLKNKIEGPVFKSYSVLKSKRGGFKTKLNWEYENEKVIGFRIYKAVLSKSQLQKEYTISQLALERLTSTSNAKAGSQILYDKNFFVENSKVKFFKSDTSKFKIKESVPTKMDYSLIGFIRSRPGGLYSFEDGNVKFGNSYSYVVTGMMKTLNETRPGSGMFVNIEDLTPPPSIKNFNAEETSSGILITFTGVTSSDTASFRVYRRRVGDIEFKEVFEGPTTQKSGYFVDSTVIPGNEYEYKVYLIDFFGNVGWSSKIVRVEFLSRFLSKGAIIDPLVKIVYRAHNIVVEGRRNSDRILGYRIERQDIWRFQKNFEIKNNKGIPWPNVIFFDENDKLELSDASVSPNKVYRYRVSSISITGKTESIFVSPVFMSEENLEINSPGFLFKDLNPVKIKSFETEIKQTLQDPVYVKLSWKIDGDWDYLKIVFIKDHEVIVDNIHDHIFYDKLEKGKSYKVKLQVFNLEDEMVEESEITRVFI